MDLWVRQRGVILDFSRLGKPTDNAFIEALHSNLQREVIDRFEFDSIYHAQMIIDRYYTWYNKKRRHGSLKRKTPESVYKQFFNPFP